MKFEKIYEKCSEWTFPKWRLQIAFFFSTNSLKSKDYIYSHKWKKKQNPANSYIYKAGTTAWLVDYSD